MIIPGVVASSHYTVPAGTGGSGGSGTGGTPPPTTRTISWSATGGTGGGGGASGSSNSGSFTRNIGDAITIQIGAGGQTTSTRVGTFFNPATGANEVAYRGSAGTYSAVDGLSAAGGAGGVFFPSTFAGPDPAAAGSASVSWAGGGGSWSSSGTYYITVT